MLVYDFDEFYVFSLRKAGSTSIQAWAEAQSIPVTDIDFFNTSKNIYSFWRPTYDRILTGINTALNLMSWPGQDTIACRVRFYHNLYCLIETRDMKTEHELNKHTKLLTEYTGNAVNNITWIFMEDIGKFDQYIYAKYSKRYNPIGHLNAGSGDDWFNTNTFRTKSAEFGELIKVAAQIINKEPPFLEFLEEYASQDEIPDKVHTIQELIANM